MKGEPPRDPVARRSAVQPGCLYLVGTPIGNLEDITYRAVRILREVDLIAAEDTRAARVLLGRYQVETPTMSFFRGNEARREEALLERLERGEAVALISEAGMPGISDPGGRLTAACLARGIAVDVIPGPSAVTTALLLAGLPADHFCFLGFLPRSGRERRVLLGRLPGMLATLVLFEAPGRVGGSLAELAEVLGAARRAVVLREMTKLYQEVVPGTLSELAARYRATRPRGEVTVVISGVGAVEEVDGESRERALEAEVLERLGRGDRPREIALALAAEGRRRVYQLALHLSQRR